MKMKTTVRFYGVAYDNTGTREWSLELDEGAKVGDLMNHVADAFPGLKELIYSMDGSFRDYLEVSVNNEDITGLDGFDSVLNDGDVVFLMPPIGGG